MRIPFNSPLLLLSISIFLGTASPALLGQSTIEISQKDVWLEASKSDIYRMEMVDRSDLGRKLGLAKANDVKSVLPAGSLDSLPEKLQFFRFYNPEKHAGGQRDCEEIALEVYRDFVADEEVKGMEWEEKWAEFDRRFRGASGSCYYFYRKLAPELNFRITTGLEGEAILSEVGAEILYRTPPQAAGFFRRHADADLLLPTKKLGWVSCLHKDREGYQPFWASTPLFILRQLVWSETYYRTLPGKYPSRELFLLRFLFVFEHGHAETVEVLSPWILLQI